MVLELKNLGKTFATRRGGKVRAVDNLSLTLAAGDFTAVQGPSGCGKTTLLLMAGALLAPDEGEVRVADQNPYQLGAENRARFRSAHVGFVFQQFHLVPYLTVLENVLAPALAASRSDLRERALELIGHLGLTPRQDHVPGQLSTGERQRTALARALLNQPKLILADEPTGNLDHASAEAVLHHLTEFTARGGAVLLVTHDDRAARCAGRTVRIRDGRLEP